MNWLHQLQRKIIAPGHPLPDCGSQKVVFTNGCFDLLHKGHIDYLAQAADWGDRLVVGINSDDSVRRQRKGPHRPVQPLEARATLLAALAFVSAVVPFDEDTPLALIASIQPDVLVKGGDYNPHQTNPEAKDYIVGREIVLNRGGEVKVVQLVAGYSTTALLQKIHRL